MTILIIKYSNAYININKNYIISHKLFIFIYLWMRDKIIVHVWSF